jgi:hypothetical protein
VKKSHPGKVRVSQVDSAAYLVWIRNKLWKNKSFTPEKVESERAV